MEASANNRFGLLFDDDEDGPAPIVSSEITLNQKKVTPAPIQKKAQTSTKKANPNEKENKSNITNKNNAAIGAQQSQSNQKRANINGVPTDKPRNLNRPNFKDRSSVNAGGNETMNDQRQQRPFKERDNRGPFRNRYGDNGFRNGKREFDRQSGSDKTGVKPIDKRDGAGAHNWGSVKQEIDDINKNAKNNDNPLAEKEEVSAEQNEELVTVTEEDEAKEMTLDEWKSLNKQRSKPQYNLRKAGEGEDTSQWQKMVVLNKKKDGESEEELEYDPSLYPQRVGRLQRIVDIQFKFNDSRHDGGNFNRGRRGPRPFPDNKPRFDNERNRTFGDAERINDERPRNYGMKKRGDSKPLQVDDERQFPTLG